MTSDGSSNGVKTEKEQQTSADALARENAALKQTLDQLRREVSELKGNGKAAVKERADKGVQTSQLTAAKVEPADIIDIDAPSEQNQSASTDRKSVVRIIKKRSASPLGSYIGPEFLGRIPVKAEKKEEEATPPPMKRHKSSMHQSVVPFRPVSFPPNGEDVPIVDDFGAGDDDPDDPMPDRELSRLSTPPPSHASSRRPTSNPEPIHVKPEPVDEPLPLREPSKNIVFKTKEDMVFDAVTIQSRFDAVGVKPFEIDIETEVKEAAVSRKFISSVYGGSSQGTFPTIAEERVAKHGIRSLMFDSLDRHPNAPREAGLPGVWFLQEPLGKGNNKDSDGAPKDEENEEEFQAEDGGNNHDQNPSSVTPVKEPEEQKGRLTGHVSYTFVGLSPNQWRYLGQYELVEGEPLTQQEWILQTTRVRNAWAHALLRYDWGKRIRFSVIYRREHGTDPTEAQVQRADADENAYQDVTAEEIRQDFDLGKQQLGFFVMRCVGYDKAFARSIANAYAHWVDPSIKKPKKVEGKRKASASKGKEAATAKKRGRPSGGVKDDLREGDEAEEPVYVPRPTKSRSGRKGT